LREALTSCNGKCDFKKCKRISELIIEVPQLRNALIKSFSNAKNIGVDVRLGHLNEYEKKKNELEGLRRP
jgi:hypothetical protein